MMRFQSQEPGRLRLPGREVVQDPTFQVGPGLVVCQTFWKPQGWLGELILMGQWRPAVCNVTTPQRVPSLDPST